MIFIFVSTGNCDANNTNSIMLERREMRHQLADKKTMPIELTPRHHFKHRRKSWTM